MMSANVLKPATPEQTALAQRFLSWEAKLLDERRFREWYAMLDNDIEYIVPLRQARVNFGDEIPEGFRISDDKSMIDTRLKRLESGTAWAELPPSRTLRIVGSVMVSQTERAEVLEVESALMIYRQRGHDDKGDLIPVRRTDLLHITEQGLLLLRRHALTTDVVLNTPNLGVFL